MNDDDLRAFWNKKSLEEKKEWCVAFHHTAAPKRPCVFHKNERPNLNIVSPWFFTQEEAIAWRDAEYPA